MSRFLPLLTLIILVCLHHFPQHINAAECNDKVKDCSKASSYCKWPSLEKTLRVNCELTCGHCQKGVSQSNGGQKQSKPKKSPAKKKPKKSPGKKGGKKPTKPSPKNPQKQPKATYPKYKLHYFAIRFRAEPIRLMFAYKKVPFDDFRIDQKDWPTLKSNYPNGQVPALEIDGEFLMQSGSIYRYVANKLDLNGKGELEKAQLDSIAELHREFFDATTPFIQAKMGIPPGADADQIFQSQFAPAITKYAPQLVAKLKASSSGFFASRLSWVDFYVAESTLTFRGYAPTEMGQYPELLEHEKKVHELKELQDYMGKRQQTPM